MTVSIRGRPLSQAPVGASEMQQQSEMQHFLGAFRLQTGRIFKATIDFFSINSGSNIAHHSEGVPGPCIGSVFAGEKRQESVAFRFAVAFRLHPLEPATVVSHE
jgi:hypothetical protein